MTRGQFLKKRKAMASAMGLLYLDWVEQTLSKNEDKAERTQKALEILTEDWIKQVNKYVAGTKRD